MSALTIAAGGSTTVDGSGSYDKVTFQGPGALTVTQDSGTPAGDPVVVSIAAIGGSSSSQSFNVRNGATLKVGAFTSIGVRPEFNVGSNAVLELSSGVNSTSGATVNFNGPGTLVVDSGVNLKSIAGLTGFGPGNNVDFGTLATSYTYTPGASGKPGTLSLFRSGRSIGKLSVSGTYDSTDFQIAPDGHGGTSIAFACFLEGTRLATPDGEMAVETLQPGDLVLTRRNGAVPVKWIGRRTVLLDHIPDHEAVLPVRVRANAIADRIPHRDLLLSPDHALYLDGGLIPVKLIENGATIAQERPALMGGERFTYFHVELDRHDVLLAEGAPAESYLDTGNRAVFENSGGVVKLHPDFTPRRWEGDAAAPLTLSGPLLQGVRERLLQRAEAAAGRLTDDAGLHLVVDGRTIRPIVADKNCAQFVVPPGATEVRIASRASVAAYAFPSAYGDRRLLGVAIDRIVLRHNGQLNRIALDDPSLAEGFHTPERAGAHLWRWTDGNARLPATHYRDLQGAFILDLGIRGSLRYRTGPDQILVPAPASEAA